jgi:DNA-binding NarL/FixJ family response regulator
MEDNFTAMNTLKIFLIDDHKLFVQGLTSILNVIPGLEVIGYVYSAEEYLRLEDDQNPDVYLVDVNMPELSGIQLTKQIKAKKPNAKILALSMYEDSLYIEKMIQNGASGYIIKSANVKELEKAIREVAKGKTYLGEDLQKVIFDKMGAFDIFEEQGQTNKNHLSKRELEILSLIGQEKSTPQIAEKLFISERTVDTHRKNILAKTKVKTIVGLIKYAIREGLIYY